MVTICNAAGQAIHEHPGDTLAGAYLANKYLRNAQLVGQDLSGADLRDTNLTEANLEGANLSGAMLDDSDLSQAILRSATMHNASCTRTNLTGADLTQADMTESQFRDAVLDGVNAAKANFSRSVFQNGSMKKIQADNAVLRECQINHTDMSHARFVGADFSSARLVRVNLEYASLPGCLVRNAVFDTPQLFAANVSGVDFRSVAEFWTCLGKRQDGMASIWPPCNFSDVESGPVFDLTTTWPDRFRFPKRKFNWKAPAKAGFFLTSLVWWPLLFVNQERFLSLPGILGLYGCCVAILTCVHAWRVVATNIKIAEDPSRLYDAAFTSERQFLSESVW